MHSFTIGQLICIWNLSWVDVWLDLPQSRGVLRVWLRCFLEENTSNNSMPAREGSSRVCRRKGVRRLFRTTTIYWRSTDKQNGQIVVQSSHSWTWFCAQDMNHIKKERMKSHSALNLESKHGSKNLKYLGKSLFLRPRVLRGEILNIYKLVPVKY